MIIYTDADMEAVRDRLQAAGDDWAEVASTLDTLSVTPEDDTHRDHLILDGISETGRYRTTLYRAEGKWWIVGWSGASADRIHKTGAEDEIRSWHHTDDPQIED